jgi:peptidoglycan hydrolase-like amidase
MQYSAQEASTRQNPYAGSYFTRVYKARLDDSSITAYYFAGPKGKTVNVFFLNGVQRPYLEVQEGWKVDGVEYKVRIDCGAKAVDWRGLVKNPGA